MLLQWVLKHLGDCEYHISAMVLPSTVGGSAVERKKLCFLMDCVQPDVWVICGKDSMDTTDRRKVYMYFFGLVTPSPEANSCPSQQDQEERKKPF